VQQVWREKAAIDLLSQIDSIIRALRKAAPTIRELVAEAQRQADIEAERRAEQHRGSLKAEGVRQRAEAQKASHAGLLSVIEEWGRVRNIQAFLAEVERQCEKCLPEERPSVMDRLERARGMIGATNALEHLLAWKTPREIYRASSVGKDDEE
jgi:hypothetical protein